MSHPCQSPCQNTQWHPMSMAGKSFTQKRIIRRDKARTLKIGFDSCHHPPIHHSISRPSCFSQPPPTGAERPPEGRTGGKRRIRCLRLHGDKSRLHGLRCPTRSTHLFSGGNHPSSFLLLVARMLLVVRPGAPSSVLAPSSDALCY